MLTCWWKKSRHSHESETMPLTETKRYWFVNVASTKYNSTRPSDIWTKPNWSRFFHFPWQRITAVTNCVPSLQHYWINRIVIKADLLPVRTQLINVIDWLIMIGAVSRNLFNVWYGKASRWNSGKTEQPACATRNFLFRIASRCATAATK